MLLYFIWLEKPIKKIAAVFITDYLFHTPYLKVEIGDGDFFSLPISMNVLKWVEEILKILSLQAYVRGFLLHCPLITKSSD